MDYNKVAEDIVTDSAELKKVKLKNLRDITVVLPLVLKVVEIKSLTITLTSADKRGIAVAVLNKLVDVPYIPEELELVLINKFIDSNITTINKLFGAAWLKTSL